MSPSRVTGVRLLRRTFASLACLVVATAGVAIAAASPASATPAKKAPETLAALWTKIFVTPSPQNPFGTGDPSTACLSLDHTLSPFGPVGVASCPAGTGTRLFIIGSSL